MRAYQNIDGTFCGGLIKINIMAFGKTTKKKQNVTGKVPPSETTLPVTASKAKAKQTGKSAAVKESAGESAPLKVARTVKMTSVAASSHNPAGDQSIIAPTKTMAAAVGAHSGETVPAVSPASHNAGMAVTPHNVAGTSVRPSQEEISRRAYFYWAERGFQHGFAEEDWARAEADLIR